MATAAQIAGSPAFSATGSNKAPMSATAGEGQMNQEKINITQPTKKNAGFLVWIICCSGRIIIRSAPTISKDFDIDIISEITIIIPINSPAEDTMAR
jgi:hypothetical protein